MIFARSVQYRLERASSGEMGQGGQGAVHDAPVVGLEQAAGVLQAHLLDRPHDRDPRVVHPGIDPAELAQGELRQAPHGFLVRYVRREPGRPPTLGPDPLGRGPQVALVPRAEHHPRPPSRRHFRGREPDPARGSGDHDRLLLDGFPGTAHRSSPLVEAATVGRGSGSGGALRHRRPGRRAPSVRGWRHVSAASPR